MSKSIIDYNKVLQRYNKGNLTAYMQVIGLYEPEFLKHIRSFNIELTEAKNIIGHAFAFIHSSGTEYKSLDELKLAVFKRVKSATIEHIKYLKNQVSEMNVFIFMDIERMQAIFSAVDGLSEGHKTILRLCNAHGSNIPKVASELDLPMHAVKRRQSRALKSLMNILKDAPGVKEKI